MSLPGLPHWQRDGFHGNFRPILGAGIRRDMTIEEFWTFLRPPVIVTPKFDGIRCVTVPGTFDVTSPALSVPVCRSLDIIPNEWIHTKIGLACLPGLDGEIMTYDTPELFNKEPKARSFNGVQSDVMTQSGNPSFKFHVFDFHDFRLPHPHLVRYEDRLNQLKLLELPDFCIQVPWRVCYTVSEVEAFEIEMVAAGYEGICWRNVHSPYKYGRSTLKQQFLIKMKRMETAEATIEGCYEEMHNANTGEKNALGYLERTSHQANMVGKNRLGGFKCSCPLFTETFNVGSGFTAGDREAYWINRDRLVGRLITFKFQRHGTKDRPRIPIFVGLRDRRDL